jgi:Mg2+ and Co2+ transporter CorA
VWPGVHEPDDSQLLWIQQEFGLRELAIEAATALGHQVARTYDDAAMFALV